MDVELQESNRKQSISYALLGFSGNILSQVVAFYLLFYYTDVLLIPAATVAPLFFVINIWDAVNDQAIGYVMCKIKSRRGYSRPYLLWTALPMGILSVALFVSPSTSLALKIAYAFVIYFLWDITNTFLSTATKSLLPLMYKSHEQRTKNNSYIVITSVLSVLIVSSFTMPLANYLGGGTIDMALKGNLKIGFPFVMLFFVAVAVPIQLFAFANIKEKYYVPNEKPFSLLTSFKVIINDKMLVLFLCIFTLISTANSSKNISTTYYVINVLKSPESISVFFFTGIGASLIMQLFVTRIIKKISMYSAITIGICGSILGLLIMFFSKQNIIACIAGNIVFGLSSAVPANLVFVIMADFIDKCNQKYKQNLSSWLYATLNCISKIGAGVSGAMCTLILGIVHYKAGANPTPQIITGITFNFIGTTTLAYLAALILTTILIFKIRS